MSIPIQLGGFAGKHKIITILLCLVLGSTVFFAVKDWVETPTNLGSKLTYIGKEHVGCLLSFVCIGDANFIQYYFATDINSSQLKSYFKRARYDNKPGLATEDNYGINYFDFTSTVNNNTFELIYYQNTPANADNYMLPTTTKQYIIIILGNDYDIAKQSL